MDAFAKNRVAPEQSQAHAGTGSNSTTNGSSNKSNSTSTSSAVGSTTTVLPKRNSQPHIAFENPNSISPTKLPIAAALAAANTANAPSASSAALSPKSLLLSSSLPSFSGLRLGRLLGSPGKSQGNPSARRRVADKTKKREKKRATVEGSAPAPLASLPLRALHPSHRLDAILQLMATKGEGTGDEELTEYEGPLPALMANSLTEATAVETLSSEDTAIISPSHAGAPTAAENSVAEEISPSRIVRNDGDGLPSERRTSTNSSPRTALALQSIVVSNTPATTTAIFSSTSSSTSSNIVPSSSPSSGNRSRQYLMSAAAPAVPNAVSDSLRSGLDSLKVLHFDAEVKAVLKPFNSEKTSVDRARPSRISNGTKTDETLSSRASSSPSPPSPALKTSASAPSDQDIAALLSRERPNYPSKSLSLSPLLHPVLSSDTVQESASATVHSGERRKSSLKDNDPLPGPSKFAFLRKSTNDLPASSSPSLSSASPTTSTRPLLIHHSHRPARLSNSTPVTALPAFPLPLTQAQLRTSSSSSSASSASWRSYSSSHTIKSENDVLDALSTMREHRETGVDRPKMRKSSMDAALSFITDEVRAEQQQRHRQHHERVSESNSYSHSSHHLPVRFNGSQLSNLSAVSGANGVDEEASLRKASSDSNEEERSTSHPFSVVSEADGPDTDETAIHPHAKKSPQKNHK